MSIVVQHEKRRKEILEKALTVFMDEGFEDATYQRIADKCGITRTTLYLYFKNKREIFNFSIKQFLLTVEENLNKTRGDKSLGSVDKIIKVIIGVIKDLEHNRRLLSVVLDYLLHLSKNEGNPELRVRRRTVRMRHILSSMVIEGIKSGELKKIKIKDADDYLYNLIQSAIFQLVILKQKKLGNLTDTITFAVKQLAV